jgi:CRISPR-associated protein Csd1
VLEALAKYADRAGLTVEPGFSPKLVKWLIRFDPRGRFLSIDELGVLGDKKNPGKSIARCPEYPANEMNAGGKAHPLVESLNIVTLMPPKEGESIPDKDKAKWDHFVGLLDDLAGDLPDAAVVAQALSTPETREEILRELARLRAKPTDKATVAVSDDWLVEDLRATAWWRNKRGGSNPAEPGTMLDLISGELVTHLPSHPKIQGLGNVGGSSIGSSLISFDKGAFASYGLEQSANAAVSDQNAARYRAGLNRAIQNSQQLGPMLIGYWYTGEVSKEDDPNDWLNDPGESEAEAFSESDEQEARSRADKLVRAIRSGEKPKLVTARYCIFHLSGAAGRVMIRSWHEGSFVELAENVSRWFKDLSMVSSKGNTKIRSPKLIAIAATTVRDLKDLNATTAYHLHLAAFTNAKIPVTAMNGALARTRIDILENTIRPERMALLKAYLIRNTPHGEHMTPYLNEDHPSAAYHAGRLLSVYANIQRIALGDVNANVVQRFFPAMMATPVLVFGRLAKLSEFHLPKINGGLENHLREKIANIAGGLGDRLPKTFSPEEQALFALGYYHQLAFDAAERNKNSEAKKAAKNNDSNSGDDE